MYAHMGIFVKIFKEREWLKIMSGFFTEEMKEHFIEFCTVVISIIWGIFSFFN